MTIKKMSSRVGAVAVSLAIAVGLVGMIVIGCDNGGDDNPGNGGGGGGNPNINYGSFTDPRDGKKYRTVKIGDQTWMAENLNCETSSGSWCYDDNPANCVIYGRLYNWAAVMNGSASSSANPSGVQGICPSGWHVPSRAEWTALVDHAGGSDIAGGKLKSKTGWNYRNGTDEFGFSALPGGYRVIDGSFSFFYSVASYGHWWSATDGGSTNAYYWVMHFNRESVDVNGNDKGDGFSVRCVKDD